MPRGGARPGAGRPKKVIDPSDPYQGEDHKIYIPAHIRWYLEQCEGDNLSQQLVNALTELAALKPLGPGKARPRDERGHFLKESNPFAAVLRARSTTPSK